MDFTRSYFRDLSPEALLRDADFSLSAVNKFGSTLRNDVTHRCRSRFQNRYRFLRRFVIRIRMHRIRICWLCLVALSAMASFFLFHYYSRHKEDNVFRPLQEPEKVQIIRERVEIVEALTKSQAVPPDKPVPQIPNGIVPPKSTQGLTALLQPDVNGVCGDVTLIIMVASALPNVDRRIAIRQTWGASDQLKRLSVSMFFILGTASVSSQPPTLAEALQRRIAAEFAAYGDVLQGDFVDTYQNLTLKSVLGVKWLAEHCVQRRNGSDRTGPRFVLKTDDDIYVNVPRLLRFLVSEGNSKKEWVAGCIKQIMAPRPIIPAGDRQYGVRDLTLPPIDGAHPLFAAGAGYILSADIVPKIWSVSQQIRLVPIEDAFITGYCTRQLGVKPNHYRGFTCGEPAPRNECDMEDLFTAHHVKPDLQYRLWTALNDESSPCWESEA